MSKVFEFLFATADIWNWPGKRGVSLNLEEIRQLKQLGRDRVHRVKLMKVMYLGEKGALKLIIIMT